MRVEHARSPGRSRQALVLGASVAVIAALAVVFDLVPELTGPETAPLPTIRVRGARLYAGTRPWRAFGLNWGAGTHQPILDYFDHPTAAGLKALSDELQGARRLGANSMRIFLELGQVMTGPNQTNAATLAGLKDLLAEAARQRVYLDITGNIVWRANSAPAWYDRLSEGARWRVQANFWTAVARTAHGSPAVLCYELSSEPVVSETPGYYQGQGDGWTFIQSIATRDGRDARTLARNWTALLAGAVRKQDNRPVSIGLLPSLQGAFAPQNVADLLDLLIIHEYPKQGYSDDSVALVRAFAALRKPVLLGETFMLNADEATERQFLLDANPHIVGVFEFYDGRDPRHMTVETIADAVYQVGLSQFIALRSRLLDPR